MNKPASRRGPVRLLPKDMRELALSHLDRFATSKRHLRDVLKRRALRSARHHGHDPEPLLAAIDSALDWLERKGFLSDRHYAEAKSRALVARGHSRQRIAANLMGKGIDGETARSALDALAGEIGDTDLIAARAFAKKRRLGPYRKELTKHPADRKHDLAVMARAGFSLEVARAALNEEV